jgi:hypothetical protein
VRFGHALICCFRLAAPTRELAQNASLTPTSSTTGNAENGADKSAKNGRGEFDSPVNLSHLSLDCFDCADRFGSLRDAGIREKKGGKLHSA